MKTVKFDAIYIFDVRTEEAYTTQFKDGVNIITSSEIDGTDRGKSVLLKSLYHALGADAKFDTKWNDDDKVYILKFKIGDEKLSIYRSRRLFKIFDNKNNMIFTTIHRDKLSNFLGDIFGFKIYLPSRNNNELIIAPPAYTFLFNFLDQDEYNGTRFSSFDNLTQFSDFKMSVIYSHLGIYNKEYFELIKDKEKYELEVKFKKTENKELENMKNRTIRSLEGFSCPESSKALENEIYLETEKYSLILNEMNVVRNKLIELRNQKSEQEITLTQLNRFEKRNEKEISYIIKTHICPECSSTLSNTISYRSKKYNSIDSVLILKDSIKVDIAKIEDEILKKEDKYSMLISELEEIERTISENKKIFDDVVKFRGLNKLIDDINMDLVDNSIEIKKYLSLLSPIKKEIKKINDIKKIADEKYSILIDKFKVKFYLNELENKDYEKISNNFCAGGSNKPLSTIIWYLTLNFLKSDFNKDGTFFPMIFDSPNNAETDKEKKEAIVEYILNSSGNFNQLIMSSIGFMENEVKIKKDYNITFLSNPKYSLLDKKVFKDNLELLLFMNNA